MSQVAVAVLPFFAVALARFLASALLSVR